MIRIIFFGPPGSGKGTQASFIENKFKIKNISVGTLLRQTLYSNLMPENIAEKKIIRVMNSGHLINDEFIIQLITKRLNQNDCYHGFLLDGFPRTIAQALSIKKYHIDLVIQFIIPDSVLIERLTGRRIHLSSGRTYHIQYNPPKFYNLDDITGEPLTIRKDDHQDIVYQRIYQYNNNIEPLVKYYQKESYNKNIDYCVVDGNQSISKVYQELINILKKNKYFLKK